MTVDEFMTTIAQDAYDWGDEDDDMKREMSVTLVDVTSVSEWADWRDIGEEWYIPISANLAPGYYLDPKFAYAEVVGVSAKGVNDLYVRIIREE